MFTKAIKSRTSRPTGNDDMASSIGTKPQTVRRRCSRLLGVLVATLATTTVVVLPAPSAAAASAAACGATPLDGAFLEPWEDKAGGIDVGVSVLEIGTGCQWGSNADEQFLTASVAKVQVMAAVLLRLQDNDDSVDSWLDARLTQMIAYSDNTAANDLISWLGGLGQLQQMGYRFSLVDTDNAWNGDWGSTRTTSADQVRLIEQLLVKTGPLTDASRSMVRSYMGQVTSEQRWGLGSVQLTGVQALVKNGWWDNQTSSNSAPGWRLTSVGLLETNDGRSWAVAILGNDWSKESDKVLIDQLAQHIAEVVTADRTVIQGAIPTPLPVRGALQPLTQVRLLDTRSGTGALNAGSTVSVDVRKDGEVPVAVAVNVTAVNPTEAGFVTVYPSGVDRPTTSNLNVTTGRTVANMAVTPVGADGTIRVYTSVRTHLIVDLIAQWTNVGDAPVTAGRFHTVTPNRVLDTRSTRGPVAAGGSVTATVAGGQIPADARAVAVSVTVTQATDDGFWTAWPAGTPQPTTSNINVKKGDTIANTAIVAPGPGGAIAIAGQSGGQVIVDVVGWFSGADSDAGTDGLLAPLAVPLRIADTRANFGSTRLAQSSVALRVGTASGLVGNLTWVAAIRPGFITAWPTGTAQPNTSVANPDPRLAGAFANALLMGNGSDGSIEIRASDSVDIIVDVSAIFT